MNDVQNMYKRLNVISLQLEDLGLTHLKNSEMMLRRIVGNCDVADLKTFVDVIQPLYTYSRDHPHVFKSYYPLTRVVDISVPDPKVVRTFKLLVDKFLDNPITDEKSFSELTNWLTIWRDNHSKLVDVINKKPILKEIETLSEDLSKCAVIGLEAINLINKNEKTDENWVTKSLETIDLAKAPRGEVELAIIESISKLVISTKK